MERGAGRQALKKFEELWQAKRGQRVMPRRCEFDFREFMPWMGYIRIIQVMPESPRLKIVLDGGEIVNAAGVDLTGKFLDVAYGSDKLKFLLDPYYKLFASNGPIYDDLHPNDSIVNFGEINRLLLPCGVDDRVEHILYCEYAYDVLHWGSTVFADLRDLKL